MASLRPRHRRDGSEYYAVLYRHCGKQTSTSFDDFKAASAFRDLVSRFGPENALQTLRAQTTLSTLTVEQWLNHHVSHLTGVDANTVAKYQAYIRNDIAGPLGSIALAALTRDQVARWVQAMQSPGGMGSKPSSKTIANKHGFLSGALNAAVRAGHIKANPCTGIGMPRDDDPREMVFLTREQFTHLLSHVSPYWQPIVRFLVASGARFGEVTALRPGDIDRQAGTVKIRQSWKQGVNGYRLGATKTARSRRTINVPLSVLDDLDYSGEFLFTNRTNGPVRAQGFYNRVWAPAIRRAWPPVDAETGGIAPPFRPRVHDLRHTNASWLISAGVPLPVIQQHLGHESI